MRISTEFTVNAPVGRVWRLLTDVEAVAPCVPGVRLTGVDGPLYSGAVRVKVGPLVAAYSGTARFTELDEGARRAVVEASGRASRGAGGASATVTARLRAEAGRTVVGVDTDLVLTGRFAELDAGTVSAVSASLAARFAAALEAKYGFAPAGPGSTEAAGPEEPPEAGRSREDAGTGAAGGAAGTRETFRADHAFPDAARKRATKNPEPSAGEEQHSDQAEHGASTPRPAASGAGEDSAEPIVSGITGDVTGAQKFPDHADVSPSAPAASAAGAVADRLWPLLAVVVVAGGMILGYVLFT
ncbi:SRPBCC family protein [Streptomonospora nanhaiensis]|uniref:SRPBCC family protein n=1 Tax=Streptomonospora nanhaiensis TaxID=1323731 RepID=A0ABY6YRG3_9ACTN|nr:SRPBCC family protein [Streptomonospora nanhaiensis]WAE74925.1 SRPBCC family protein [Streptomonospora nanhaiensis]